MNHPKQHSSRLIDLTGKRFGRLVVIKKAPSSAKNGNARWLCRCDCGNQIIVDSQSLRRKSTRSCGCLRREINHQRMLNNKVFDKYQGNASSLKDGHGVFYSSIRKTKRNHTGVIGVSYDSHYHRYVARLRFHGKYVLNKTSNNLEEAIQMRLAAEQKYFKRQVQQVHFN
ncbi:AP2 domain-containing protein [Lactobacillus sp. CRM56-3]|uniref:AP2 domain-containing protein n=1 Tax=Secundilactobacillus folii TaxID=2678357 RepID=A0A7X2XVS4_9LACO|nr:AP2 domain-containing protein [Secundilactobacillus folii]